jgi:hypothetical protein
MLRRVALLTVLLGGCVQNGLDVQWAVTLDGTTATCDQVGATDVRVRTMSTTSGGASYIDRFVCSDLHGVTQELTAGDYSVDVDLLDTNDAVIDTVPGNAGAPVTVKSGGLVKIPLVEFALSSGGTISGSWDITMGGMASTCAAVGATQVEFLATDSQMMPHSFLFDCNALTGTSNSLAPGSYTVVVNLLDSGMALLSMSSPTTAVVMAGTDTQMGLFTFAL